MSKEQAAKLQVVKLLETTAETATGYVDTVQNILKAKESHSSASFFQQKPSSDLLTAKEKLEDVSAGAKDLMVKLGFTPQQPAATASVGFGFGSSATSEEDQPTAAAAA